MSVEVKKDVFGYARMSTWDPANVRNVTVESKNYTPGSIPATVRHSHVDIESVQLRDSYVAVIAKGGQAFIYPYATLVRLIAEPEFDSSGEARAEAIRQYHEFIRGDSLVKSQISKKNCSRESRLPGDSPAHNPA